jgi:hypothetical protein
METKNMAMRMTSWMAGAALALGGCATTGTTPGSAPQPRIRNMTYATLPCHGFCPVYSVTIDADGEGMFTGTSNTAVTGPRRFTATPAQVADFFGRLQPYLPTGDLLLSGPDACKMYATDLPAAEVTWSGTGGSGHLLYNYGCDRDAHRTLAEALRTAPQALPIADLIGKR